MKLSEIINKKEEKVSPRTYTPRIPRFNSSLDVIDKIASNLRLEGALNRDEERLEKILNSKHRNNTWQYSAIKIVIEYLMKMKVIK